MPPTVMEQPLDFVSGFPQLSPIARDILSVQNQSISDLCTVLGKDAKLTKRLIRAANLCCDPASFPTHDEIEALSRLGVKRAQALIFLHHWMEAFPENQSGHFNSLTYWRETIATAICAREIAQTTRDEPMHALCAALTHAAGQPLLARHFGQCYDEVAQYQANHGCTIIEAERAVLQTTRYAAARTLARHWHLPDAVCTSLDTAESGDGTALDGMAAIVHIAHVFCIALNLAQTTSLSVPPVCPSVWEKFNFSESDCIDIFSRAEQEVSLCFESILT